MASTRLNLSAVDEAYGERADLYRDVLRIKSNATTDDVKHAYFNRRDELFQILAKMDKTGTPHDSPQRYQIERQIDAVVLALRVLGDADARLNYDFMRGDRVSGRNSLSPLDENDEDDEDEPVGTKTNGKSRQRARVAFKKAISFDDDEDSNDRRRADSHSIRKAMSQDEASKTQKTSRRSLFSRPKSLPPKSASLTPFSKRKSHKVTPPRDLEEREKKSYRREGNDDTSQVSEATTLSKAESRMSVFDRVANELLGVVEDTTLSVEQVLGAFTLREEDIDAVVTHIDQVMRKLED